MNKEEFSDYFKGKGYAVEGTMAFGVENEYPAAVMFVSKSNIQVRITAEVNGWKKLKKELKSHFGKDYGFSYYNRHLVFGICVKTRDYADTMHKITEYLKQQRIPVPDTCPYCKQKGCNALVSYEDGYHPVHKGCLDNLSGTVFSMAEKNELNGNYFLGLIGALLGAVVGVIPSLISIIAVNTIYSILFALIPLCIYQGYKILKGRMNKAVIGITIVLSVFSVYIIQIILLAYALIADFGLTIGQVWPYLFEALGSLEVWKELTGEAVIDFVFIALGIWIAWGRITKTSDSEVQNIKQILATVRPYGTPEEENTGSYGNTADTL